jgi:hypothetical protein
MRHEPVQRAIKFRGCPDERQSSHALDRRQVVVDELSDCGEHLVVKAGDGIVWRPACQASVWLRSPRSTRT